MDITKSFDAAFKRAQEKNWDHIYIVVDIHDTIFKASYENEEMYEYFPYAKEALRIMSSNYKFKLILWSSSYTDNIKKYMINLVDNNIHFDYINCNPEVTNTELACFDNKLYFNVGIDNAFGFEADKDWKTIYEYLTNK